MSEAKTYKIVNGDMSDGYHTFDELYEHRCLLWICYVTSDGCPGRSYLKLDHFQGWDLLGVETAYGQISYHVPSRYRSGYSHITQRDVEFDGHKPVDVAHRLLKIAEVSK